MAREDLLKLGKAGFMGLVGKMSGGKTTGPSRVTTDQLPGQLPLFGMGDEAADVTTRLSRVGGRDYGKNLRTQRKTAKQEARTASGKPYGLERVKGFAYNRPGIALPIAGIAGVGAATTLPSFASLIPGIGESTDYNLAELKPLTAQEQALQRGQSLIDTAYGTDPIADLQYQTQAINAANAAAAAYEKLGRPDLAEGARQEVMNTYNEYKLRGQGELAQQRREALGILQSDASELAGTRMAPSELRATANEHASTYYSLAEEDRNYYANLGYDTVEKFINGKINGEI